MGGEGSEGLGEGRGLPKGAGLESDSCKEGISGPAGTP